MKVPFFTTKYQDKKYGHIIRQNIDKVIKAGNFILGNEVLQFEKAIESYTGAKHAIGVGSGSDALFLAFKCLDIPINREVITTPFTFFASTSSIVNNGLKPIFVDVDDQTYNINPDLIEEKINNNTEAILPVDLFSQTANYDKIGELAKKYNIKIIEDSAEAFGMKWNDLYAGLCGDLGIYSFYPTKTLGAFGDGGMIVTNDDFYAEKIKCLRVHGASKKYYHKYVGINSRLDALQASILRIKLKYIDEEIKEREKIYNQYVRNLNDIQKVQFPQINENASPVWYVLNVRCERRNELKKYLKKNGIETLIYYPKPMHLQDCFQNLGYKEGDFPVAEKLCDSLLALPIFIGMSNVMINYVCNTIKDFYNKN
ncbi:MAG: DegT/DnrJ/EryC1/StrS family aminotransferase [Candidatus Lokiarchaeota archaeon]